MRAHCWVIAVGLIGWSACGGAAAPRRSAVEARPEASIAAHEPPRAGPARASADRSVAVSEIEDDPPITVTVDDPRYRRGTGPRIAVDQAHHELHSLETTYGPFADVLRQDGYRVAAVAGRFDPSTLADLDVLVIANALHPSSVDRWAHPTASAFTEAEVEALVAWIEEGGRLWLIADHMPFPGAAHELARALGFTFHDGFAFLRTAEGFRGDHVTHRRADGTVGAHPITAGVEQVRSFTGQAFEAPADASVLLTMPPEGVLLMTAVAWEFEGATELDCPGWPVAAVRRLGAGRVAVFGEAAMLSARWIDRGGERVPVGFHDPEARDNVRLLRNVAAWLSEGLSEAAPAQTPTH